MYCIPGDETQPYWALMKHLKQMRNLSIPPCNAITSHSQHDRKMAQPILPIAAAGDVVTSQSSLYELAPVDWDGQRERILSLYSKYTVKEIQAIMAREGYYAT